MSGDDESEVIGWWIPNHETGGMMIRYKQNLVHNTPTRIRFRIHPSPFASSGFSRWIFEVRRILCDAAGASFRVILHHLLTPTTAVR
jgi:hypothetical protein